ncbi:DUF3152 domain-containing protein [Actinoplanes sp. Pm04-4]|uniref:DUF3152 domain-containing protein n=1 Tax=Paractinoplanes pyxinae TaxID=2997416 RepID=A0ABT4B9U3_9ACTN|nr:DUF3152 domain-containing protein [Actinoplanes pyxinae]MCY1143284.1 DUF3152 domain-containing protein [Actinoplanes pyxinae]
MMRFYRWAVAVLVTGTLAACDSAATEPPPVAAEQPVVASTPARASAPSRSAPRPKPIAFPDQGAGRWRFAPAGTATAGRGGRLLRYRVAVEQDITGVSAVSFAAAAEATLADPRGWIRGRQWRFRRVGPGQEYDMTLYLATPLTRDKLCADVPDGYTSCRNGNKVVLNVARWAKGVPFYKGKLTTYRQYMVNHEVGHRLGHGHERCPAPGELAPVMQQQTLGMHGCTINPWPYPDGTLYHGPSGQYPDQPPAD